jgi:cyclopropane fatty-acyl-phospholipid synthase-like methyltransferase
MTNDIYLTGDYLKQNPGWHKEHSLWKAKQIIRMMDKNMLSPKSICEVGCGAGEILRQLQLSMPHDCQFYGYEISPQAFQLCETKVNNNINYYLKDILLEKDSFFDVILLIDVIEHIEDYFHFMRSLKPKSTYKILHIPLDLSVQSVLRLSPLIRQRQSAGHIHYFTKDTILMFLKEVGYTIKDYFYTASAIELPGKPIKTILARLPRRFLYCLHKDLSVRLLGGYSLMVLVQ